MRFFRNCSYGTRFQTSSVKTSLTPRHRGGTQSCRRAQRSSARHAQKASPARAAPASPCMHATPPRDAEYCSTRTRRSSVHTACPLSLPCTVHLVLPPPLLLTAPQCQAPPCCCNKRNALLLGFESLLFDPCAHPESRRILEIHDRTSRSCLDSAELSSDDF